MLSFEHHPAHYFRQEEPFFNTHCSFADDFDSFFNPLASRPVIRRCAPTSRQYPYSNHHSHHHAKHHHHVRQLPREQSFADLLSLLDVAQTPSKPEVFTKVVESKNSYQLFVKKNDNGSSDFRSYLIRYVVDGNQVNIIIESSEDDFQKVYTFNRSNIDINGVKWRIARNTLIVEVPKQDKEFLLQPSAPRRAYHQKEPSTPNKQTTPKQAKRDNTEPKATKTSEVKEQKKEVSKPRVISIPIEFLESNEDFVFKAPSKEQRQEESEFEAETASETASEVSTPSPKVSRSNSNASEEDQPSPKLPKLTRKVSIEEVEDESFLQMDLD